MSQVQVTVGLLNLPAEILLDILGYLNVYEASSSTSSKVCNDIRQVINSSSELLYLIDLKYFNAIPVPLSGPDGADVGTRRKLLQQSETAWQKAEYSKINHIPIPYAPLEMHKWSSGIIGLPLEPLEQITFVQPTPSPNNAHTTNWQQRSCKIDKAVIENYCFSPAQDLVVLLSRVPSGESHVYDVTFRSLSEDKVHPEAAFPVLKALDNQVDLEFFDSVTSTHMIFGDYYGLFCKNAHKADGSGVVDLLQIWNWKSKDAFQCLEVLDEACGTLNFSFLTNDKLIVVNAKELLLYSLVNSANAIQLTAKFSLPALRDPFECKNITFSHIPSHASTHNQLIAFSMDIQSATTNCPCFTFYVERNTLLELGSTYTSLYGQASQDSASLPWSTWGPKHTRTFKENKFDPCKHSVFGFRTAGLTGDLVSPEGKTQRRSLCIRDFNPHRVMDFKAGNGTQGNQRLIEGETTSSSLFLEPLGSALPYLELTTEEKFIGTELTMEANRVTLLSFEVVSRSRILMAGMARKTHEVVQSIEVLDFE
ncbi:hypothetical protein DFH29DRAFT_1083340 [Suillus ampliporus]|nr:hypothetical protein DFH29DRAFT_1083340 [Suillus ampliporus]